MDGVVVRRARPDEAAVVLDVLDAAATRLAARGIGGLPAAFRPELIEPGLGQGKAWLAERAGTAVATLTRYWSDELWADGGRAGYVHRLATRESGTGLGAAFLRWAADTVRARGRDRLRLDCAAVNHGLRAYYERAGFAHRGDLVVAQADVCLSGELSTVSRYELDL